MIRLGIVCTVAALVASGLFSTALGAGPKSRPHTPAHDDEADDVNLVLLREQTRALDRRAELHSVLNRQPDLAPARWHSGYVETSGSWRSYASPADPQTLELLEQYRRKRSILDGTVRAQVHLAHWCHEQGLRDQARAHLTAALADAQPADRPAIYERLGYHQVGDHWLSPGEIAEWSTIGKQAEASFKHWGPIIERIAAQLDGNPHLKRIARKALEDIRDPAAIPAIEAALLYRNEVGAHAAIETLQQIDAYQASQALSRAAVF
ncbi:MAG TPA: hypothetical protein VHB77_06820, partial [Planctomycetaceae bacterium]|nr:hypothetical protein [Planctomycetaceae bacterium]